MKKSHIFLLALFWVLNAGLLSCKSETKEETGTDSKSSDLTVPSNSDATNPSLADTSYTDSSGKQDTIIHPPK
jgi:hypothetical protein